MAPGETANDAPARPRLLLVEANDADAERLLPLLREPRCELTRARGVLDAIRLAGESRFDVAVLEYEQPDGTAFDLLDVLRVGNAEIRILLLGPRVGEDVALRALSLGASEFLVKDLHLDQELPRRFEALIDFPADADPKRKPGARDPHR